MKALTIEELENIYGGEADDMDHFAGGIACGAAVGGVLIGNPLFILAAVGCWNYVRKGYKIFKQNV